MQTQILLSLLVALLAGVLAVYCFRKPARRPKKVVLMGARNTGKTRLFLALSRREVAEARTVPTLEEHTERLPSGVLLVDTPGRLDAPSHPLLGTLAPSDVVLYLFNDASKLAPPETRCQVVRVYTGESPVPETACDIALNLDEGVVADHDLKQLMAKAGIQ